MDHEPTARDIFKLAGPEIFQVYCELFGEERSVKVLQEDAEGQGTAQDAPGSTIGHQRGVS